MRKTVFSLLLITVLAACQKETVNSTPPNGPENVVTEQPKAPGSVAALAEVGNDQLAGLLNTKANDTVYVTNFFATWCRPCMVEMPHFKEKMDATKGEKIKFTFVNIDAKEDWQSKVLPFGNNLGIAENIVLYDTAQLSPDFFSEHTDNWDGNSIPFTLITKGDKRVETVGMMTKEDLDAKLASLK